ESRESRGPILAVAAEEADRPAFDPGDQTIAVELDLVQPAVSARRDVRPGCELRLDAARHRGSSCSRDRARVDRRLLGADGPTPIGAHEPASVAAPRIRLVLAIRRSQVGHDRRIGSVYRASGAGFVPRAERPRASQSLKAMPNSFDFLESVARGLVRASRSSHGTSR